MTLSTKIEDLIQCWLLGAEFQTPAFQNHIMKSIRWGFKNPDTRPVINTVHVENIYRSSTHSSQIKKFIVRCMVIEGPWAKVHNDPAAFGTEKYSREHPGLHQDSVIASREGWNDKKVPWDDKYREDYMLKEVKLSELYERWILGQRTKMEIASSARNLEDPRSILELDHLKRNKQHWTESWKGSKVALKGERLLT